MKQTGEDARVRTRAHARSNEPSGWVWDKLPRSLGQYLFDRGDFPRGSVDKQSMLVWPSDASWNNPRRSVASRSMLVRLRTSSQSSVRPGLLSIRTQFSSFILIRFPSRVWTGFFYINSFRMALATIYVIFSSIFNRKHSKVEFSPIFPQFLDFVLGYGKSSELVCVSFVTHYTMLHHFPTQPHVEIEKG